VDDEEGGTEARLGVPAHTGLGEAPAAAPINDLECFGTHRGAAQPVQHAEKIEAARGIGGELDAGAGLFQLDGALQHGDDVAGACCRQRDSKPAYSGTGDDDGTCWQVLTAQAAAGVS
jgi:hypothetical protein